MKWYFYYSPHKWADTVTLFTIVYTYWLFWISETYSIYSIDLLVSYHLKILLMASWSPGRGIQGNFEYIKSGDIKFTWSIHQWIKDELCPNHITV